MTYSGFIDLVGNRLPQLSILFCIFALGEDLDRESATLELFKVLSCVVLAEATRALLPGRKIPFLGVVRMYSVSVVKSIRVVGNSYPRSQNYQAS